MHDFLLKCFQKNPDDRASSADLLQHPWILKNQKPAQPKKRDVKSLGKSVKKKLKGSHNPFSFYRSIKYIRSTSST